MMTYVRQLSTTILKVNKPVNILYCKNCCQLSNDEYDKALKWQKITSMLNKTQSETADLAPDVAAWRSQ